MNGFDGSLYHGFSEDVTGSVKFYARAMIGLNDEDVRIANRMSIPAKRLRGFQYRKVGPKDGTDYVGGNYMTAMNFAATLPNVMPNWQTADFSVFLDAGNVWGVDYTNIDETNTLRSSIGMSANIFTTIGPLSFTVAQDLSKADNDETETFNFRLGTSF